jgi:hypothetical protein
MARAINGGNLLDDFERVFQFSGVGEDFFEPGRLAELFAQGNIFGFELLAEFADFFVGEGVGGGDGECARNIFEDGFFGRRKRTLLETNEGGDAEHLAAHHEWHGGVGADAVFCQVILVAEPAVFFEEIVAGIGFPGEFVLFLLFRVRKQRARFGERRRLCVTVGACGELLRRFAVDGSDADDVQGEEAVEIAVFVRYFVGNGEVDDADGVERD